MMYRRLVGAVVAGCLAAVSWALADDRPVALCPSVTQAPVIDGVLDDAVWQDAPVNRVLTDNMGEHPAQPPMQFRLVTDGEWLYLGVELEDPDTSGYDLTDRGRDAVSFRGETLDIFLAPHADAPLYFQFALEPGGSNYDNQAGGNPADHNFGWKHAQRVHPTGWVAEIALPLGELGRTAPLRPGDRMALNVCRATRGPVPLHAWSPTFGQFHNRNAFGEVVVGSFAAPAEAQVRSLRDRLAGVRRTAPASARAELDAWQAELDALGRTAAQLADGESWRAFRAQAERARRELHRLGLSGRGMVVWEVPPWSLPGSRTLPDADTEDIEEVNIQVLQGEHVARALAIANTSEEPLHLRCFSTDLLSPDWRRQRPAREHLTLHEAVEVGLRGGGVQRDALPEVRLESRIVVPGGRNGVLWLSVNSHGLPAGTWTAGITLQPLLDTRQSRVIRVVLHVLPAQMHQGPRPYSCGWTTLTAPPCSRYPEKCVEDELAHYMSVHIVSFGDVGLNKLKFDEGGRLVEEFDFSGLEKAVQRYGTEGRIYVLVGFYNWLPKELGGRGSWTELEQDNFTRFARAVRGFFEEKGMSTRDFAWYALDEPVSEEDAEHVVNFGKLMQAADPEQQIFVTVYGKVTLEALEMMAPYVNLWVPSLGLNEEQRAIVEKTRPEWRRLSYSVLPRSAHPYWNYRSSGITAFARGYEGIGFWNYNDCGGSPNASVWDDNDGTQSDYSVIYEGSDGPVTSVRWEAWRQGIQDYRYCEWLLDMAHDTADEALAGQAREIVGELLDRYRRSGVTTTADEIISRMRPLALRLLVSTGRLDAATLEEAWAAEALPLCLTANAGPLGRNLRTRGHYTYNATPSPDHHGERCRVTEGPVYFQGEDAPSGPQSENKADGNLTDGLTSYPRDYSIHWWPPATLTITFDFLRAYRLGHLHFIGDERPLRALVSETGEDGSWREASTAAVPRPEDQLTADGATYMDLGGVAARFVRLEITTGGEGVRMGEVRIWGWPVD